MKYGIYMFFDRCANLYSNVYLSLTNGTALRDFQSMLEKHPYKDDMELYKLGEVDTATGDIERCREFVCAYSSIAPVGDEQHGA